MVIGRQGSVIKQFLLSNHLTLHQLVRSMTMASSEIVTESKKQEEACEEKEDARKRSAPTDAAEEDGPVQAKQPRYRKRKAAMFMCYSGKGYYGMQRNPGYPTIESELMDALVKGGVVTEEHAKNPGPQISFQRAARTDKGVSAAGQVCSLKMSSKKFHFSAGFTRKMLKVNSTNKPLKTERHSGLYCIVKIERLSAISSFFLHYHQMFIDVENAVEKINSHLPEQIRVLGYLQVTKGFDSKNACNGRTYTYMLPTFAFTPVEQMVTEDYRITEDVHRQVNIILSSFVGTHNFHNYTSGKKATDPSAHRYIISFKMGDPFVVDGIEFAVITIRGQSFMLHQIRKMIGVTITIMRGYASKKLLIEAWGHEKADIPRAPGLGLMLERVHYDEYNRNYGSDGHHAKLDWNLYQDTIDEFKKKYIFSTVVEVEKEEKSMMKWLETLLCHKFLNRSEADHGSLESSATQDASKSANTSEKAEADSTQGQASEQDQPQNKDPGSQENTS